MKRLQRAAVVVQLVERFGKRGSWCGETHVQKAVFFLQEALRVPLEFDFVLYKYGPFSFGLRDEITAMRADGMLCLESRQAPYGPSLVPGEGAALLREDFPKTLKRYKRHIAFVAEELGSEEASELEQLGTALYVMKENGGTQKARAKRIAQLKPHITKDQALRAVSTVAKFLERAPQGR